MLDRIDLQVVMQRVPAKILRQGYGEGGPHAPPESTACVAQRIQAARAQMVQRNPPGTNNHKLNARDLRELSEDALSLWEQAMAVRALSARSGQQLLSVARTIADLDGDVRGRSSAVAEALTYRSFAP